MNYFEKFDLSLNIVINISFENFFLTSILNSVYYDRFLQNPMNTWVLHNSNDRNNCYMKTNKFYQICAFHGEVNTICHFAKNVLKNLCYFSFIWWVPSAYILYLQNFWDFIKFDRFQRRRLIIKFCYKFQFCNIFFTIYSDLSILWYILEKSYKYMSFGMF